MCVECLDEIDRFVDFLDLDDSGLLENGLIEIVSAREVRGVSSCSACTLLRHSSFPDQQRFAGSEGAPTEIEQRPTVRETFDVGHDNFRFDVVEQRVDELDRPDVGFITGRDHVPEADRRARTGKCNTVAKATALSDERHRAFAQLGRPRNAAECGVDVLVNVSEAKAIRTHDAHATCVRDLEHSVLARNAFSAAFTKSPAQDNCVGHAFTCAVFDHRHDAPCRHADDGDIDITVDGRH